MMDPNVLRDLIKWTMKNYGSDAAEKGNRGQKLASQINHIVMVYEMWNRAHDALIANGVDVHIISLKLEQGK